MPSKLKPFMKPGLLAAILLIVSSGSAFAITADGNLADWGVNPGAFGVSDWTPNAGVHYAEEDQNPAVDFLNPGYGGQKFDVEAIYFSADSTFAYIAVVSGFPLEGRQNFRGLDYFAGDLTFDFGSDGSWEFGLETTGDWTGSVAGGLYGDPAWINPTFHICGPYALSDGTYLGLTTFGYDKTTYSAFDHYVFETAIPISLFGTFWDPSAQTPEMSIKWTMSCGNDCVTLDVPFSPVIVPEPATLTLFGIGLAGAVFRKRFTGAAG